MSLSANLTCSTPFGVTDFGGLCQITVLRQYQRAQRLSASLTSAVWIAVPPLAVVMCSTPFGVTDFGGTGRYARLSASMRAQRLSASLTSAAAAPSDGPRTPEPCSTPFGVTDFGGAFSSATLHRRPVLNAFRRH